MLHLDTVYSPFAIMPLIFLIALATRRKGAMIILTKSRAVIRVHLVGVPMFVHRARDLPFTTFHLRAIDTRRWLRFTPALGGSAIHVGMRVSPVLALGTRVDYLEKLKLKSCQKYGER